MSPSENKVASFSFSLSSLPQTLTIIIKYTITSKKKFKFWTWKVNQDAPLETFTGLLNTFSDKGLPGIVDQGGRDLVKEAHQQIGWEKARAEKTEAKLARAKQHLADLQAQLQKAGVLLYLFCKNSSWSCRSRSRCSCTTTGKKIIIQFPFSLISLWVCN